MEIIFVSLSLFVKDEGVTLYSFPLRMGLTLIIVPHLSLLERKKTEIILLLLKTNAAFFFFTYGDEEKNNNNNHISFHKSKQEKCFYSRVKYKRTQRNKTVQASSKYHRKYPELVTK